MKIFLNHCISFIPGIMPQGSGSGSSFHNAKMATLPPTENSTSLLTQGEKGNVKEEVKSLKLGPSSQEDWKS